MTGRPPFIRWLGFGALSFLITGCLSPETLRPVADQNSENIRHLRANTAKLAAALEKEVAFHAGMEIEMARVSHSVGLIGLTDSWLGGPNPTASALADPTKEPHMTLLSKSKQAQARLLQLRDGGTEEAAVLANLATTFPLTADIALGNAGFSELRVIADAFALKAVNSAISGETDADVRLTLYAKRNKILDAYLPVAQRIEAAGAYADALEEFLEVVKEQGEIAIGHADSISAYAQATLQFDTITGALQDQDLRKGVLGILAKKKGQAYADRVQGHLAKADSALGVIDDLR